MTNSMLAPNGAQLDTSAPANSQPNKAQLEIREDWYTPGVCLLARGLVSNRGILGRIANRYMTPSGIWAYVNANEAGLIGAPFAWQDADPFVGVINDFLNRHQLTLKFITLSHLHLDHSAGLGSLLEHYPHIQFVYPQSWPRLWKSWRFDRVKFGWQPEIGRQFSRDKHFQYTDHHSIDLAGEPVHFLEAPYHSWTDHLAIFRGFALLPDWHLPVSQDEKLRGIDTPKAITANTLQRVRQFENDNKYQIHHSAAVHADEPCRDDFQYRLDIAYRRFVAN